MKKPKKYKHWKRKNAIQVFCGYDVCSTEEMCVSNPNVRKFNVCLFDKQLTFKEVFVEHTIRRMGSCSVPRVLLFEWPSIQADSSKFPKAVSFDTWQRGRKQNDKTYDTSHNTLHNGVIHSQANLIFPDYDNCALSRRMMSLYLW